MVVYENINSNKTFMNKKTFQLTDMQQKFCKATVAHYSYAVKV